MKRLVVMRRVALPSMERLSVMLLSSSASVGSVLWKRMAMWSLDPKSRSCLKTWTNVKTWFKCSKTLFWTRTVCVVSVGRSMQQCVLFLVSAACNSFGDIQKTSWAVEHLILYMTHFWECLFSTVLMPRRVEKSTWKIKLYRLSTFLHAGGVEETRAPQGHKGTGKESHSQMRLVHGETNEGDP